MTTARIRIIRHEAVPKTGSFEVRFADGRASKYFYYDDVLGRGAGTGQDVCTSGARSHSIGMICQHFT